MLARWCSTILTFWPEALYDDEDADAHDQRQHARQRSVQAQSPQCATARRERAARARGENSSNIMSRPPDQRSFNRPRAPASKGQMIAPTTGANHRAKLVTDCRWRHRSKTR